ncbi:MAG: prephenate dehydrogenase/arogenate dehydrogenase family protein [Acidobacteria bacterium]|nr:prephenate dehydrogenase/arogenate dehydrogenase family protein [Acidobacteriota bacterium]
MSFRTIGIVGVGLIGGSFGLAMRKAGFADRILGVSSERSVAEGLRAGAIDEGASLEEAAEACDLLFLAHPIRRILEQLPRIAALAKPGALVTDAGSTKAAIARTAQAAFAGKPSEFLPGHPMAGKEGRGAAIADADLYHGATWVLTPLAPGPLSPAAAELESWLGRIGALVGFSTPEEHDRIVALTSHLPQALSTALASALDSALENPEDLALAGGGLRDMTRLAGSSFGIWADIFETNQGNVAAALDRMIEELRGLRAEVGSPAVSERFERAQRFHSRVRRK